MPVSMTAIEDVLLDCYLAPRLERGSVIGSCVKHHRVWILSPASAFMAMLLGIEPGDLFVELGCEECP